jgi:tellurite resistance protein TerC
MPSIRRSTRKVLVLLAGVPVIIVGILLLVLPGPGILVIILGLFILSLEFEWAKRYLDKTREMQRRALAKAKAKKHQKKSK